MNPGSPVSCWQHVIWQPEQSVTVHRADRHLWEMYDPATPQFLEQVGLDLSENSESKEQSKGKSSEIHPNLMPILLYNSLKNSYGTGVFVPVHGHGGVEADIQAFLTTALDGCERSASCPCRCNLRRSLRQPLCGNQRRSDRQITCPCQVQNHNSAVIQPTA